MTAVNDVPRQVARQIRMFLDDGERNRLIVALALLEPPDDEEQPIVATRITITRHYWPNRENPEDADTIMIDVDGEPTMVEAMGMLEMAKLHWVGPAVQAAAD